jgi:hypothetical protein
MKRTPRWTVLQHDEKRARRTSVALLVGLWIVMLVIAVSLIAFVDMLFRSPAGQSLTSLDWSGYVVVSDFSNPQPVFASVSGSWIVPQVNVSQKDTFSAAWIGIGGELDETLIQTGTEHDSINQQAVYSAWYELLPYDAVTITTINVSAGDRITAYIGLVNSASNEWMVRIEDVTSGQNFSTNLFYDSSRLSAEWIVERPTVNNNIGTLANFGSITFSGPSATADGRVVMITDLPFSRVTMYNRKNSQLVTVSSPASKTSSFTVTYLNVGS